MIRLFKLRKVFAERDRFINKMTMSLMLELLLLNCTSNFNLRWISIIYRRLGRTRLLLKMIEHQR